MVRTESDTILRNALLRSVIRSAVGEAEEGEEYLVEAPSSTIDPGATSEIRLNVAE